MNNIMKRPNFKESELHIVLPEAGKDSTTTVMLSYVLKGELHQMQRSKDEEMIKSMQRLARTCASKLEKKTKAKKTKATAIPHSSLDEHITAQQNSQSDIVIEYEGKEINLQGLTNLDFQNGMVVRSPLITFTVLVNPPNIVQFTTYPKSNITVGCPIVPTAQLEFADDYECLWYYESDSNMKEYVFLSDEKVFCPAEHIINHKLKVYCTPIRYHSNTQEPITGRTTVFYLSSVVQAQPKAILSQLNECRKDYLAATASTASDPSNLRVLTYNILSEGYCLQERSVDILYGYVKREYLETEFRMQRILLEIITLSADIIALQECDKKVFDQYFLPYLGALGYVGHYTNKISQVVEGCALFISSKKCRVLQFLDVPLKHILRNASYVEPLYQMRPDLRDIVGGKLGTIGQIAIVQSLQHPENILLLANTHLFYHPLASYLRLLQCYALLQRLEEIRENIVSIVVDVQSKDFTNPTYDERIDDYAIQLEVTRMHSLLKNLSISSSTSAVVSTDGVSVSANSRYTVGTILLGDLNTTKDTPAYEFLSTGKLSKKALGYGWERLSFFRWGNSAADTADASEEIELLLEMKDNNDAPSDTSQRLAANIGPISNEFYTHSFALANATPDIQYTNYVQAFKEVLDYIFISENTLEVRAVAPMPSIEELQKETAIPSSVFPSDHLSVCVDIAFR